MTTAKTPEEIALDALCQHALAARDDIAAEIRAYGEQCASQALAEQKAPKPLEPTKLEMVAMAIFAPDGQIHGGRVWDLYRLDEREWFLIRARAAIEALKNPSDEIFRDLSIDFSSEGWPRACRTIFNLALDSILSEVKP